MVYWFTTVCKRQKQKQKNGACIAVHHLKLIVMSSTHSTRSPHSKFKRSHSTQIPVIVSSLDFDRWQDTKRPMHLASQTCSTS